MKVDKRHSSFRMYESTPTRSKHKVMGLPSPRNQVPEDSKERVKRIEFDVVLPLKNDTQSKQAVE